MNSESKPSAISSPIFAYVAPFATFMVLLSLVPTFGKLTASFKNIWFIDPAFIWYPFQTIVCAILLIWVWKRIDFRGIAYLTVTFTIGFFVFAIWTSPQYFQWAPPRFSGFNPESFPVGSPDYWFTVIFRFIRLVIIVPLVEEIFWRGFLMRYLINEDFTKVRVGTYQTKAFIITTLAFAAAHYGNSLVPSQDFYAAIITGIIFGGVTCLTRSLGSAVFVHAVTNFFLGLYIMFTKQWGFW